METKLIEFLIENRDFVLEEIKSIEENKIQELDYFFKLQREDYICKIIKDFLLDHFPEELENIHLLINKECVIMVFGSEIFN